MARALALGATAIGLAAIDLAHKSGTAAVNIHARSGLYVAFVIVLATLWIGAILAARSFPLAVGGGVLAGGAVGNLVSLALWPGVPNPIVVDAIAFNLADVFVLTGFLLVATAALVFAILHASRLREPVRLR